jgi:hypothetical protein
MTEGTGQGASAADRALTLAAVLLVTAWLGWIQMSFAGLYDLDSYFHVRAAEQLAAHGVAKTFPQATQSTWRDAYSDKDFLFHVLSIPFVTGDDPFEGGKWCVIALQLLVLASFAFALRSFDLRFGALWLVLLAATSPYYVSRLSSLRPHVLGLAFVIVEIALLYRNRWKTLFVVSGLHVLAHSSFVLLPILLVVRFVASWRSRAWPWRSAAAIVVGMVVASLAHPYFPNNLTVAWDQLFGVASNVWFKDASVPREAFGSELGPMTWQSFLAQWPGWSPAVAGALLVLATRMLGARSVHDPHGDGDDAHGIGARGVGHVRDAHRAPAPGVRTWAPALDARILPAPDAYLALVTVAMLAIASRSRRFVDVFVASALLLAAALWTRLAAGRSLGELLRTRALRTAPCALALGALAVFAVWRASGIREGFQRQAMGNVYASGVLALNQLADAEDVVYHNSWMDFALLYAFRPEGRYISGLDPIFLYQHSPELFAKNLELSRGVGRGDAAVRVIADDFRGRWVFVTMQPRDQRFRQLLQRTKGVRLVYQDGIVQLWQVLREPAPAAASTSPATR